MRFTRSTLPGVQSTSSPTLRARCIHVCHCSVSRYRAHLSKEEVAKLVAPHPDTLELVHSWFAHHSVDSSSISTTHGGSWLTVTGVPCPKPMNCSGHRMSSTGAQGRMIPLFSVRLAMHSPWRRTYTCKPPCRRRISPPWALYCRHRVSAPSEEL